VPLLVLITGWIIRRRILGKRSERVVGAAGVFGVTGTFILNNAQQVIWKAP
jgi:hypothetical protein